MVMTTQSLDDMLVLIEGNEVIYSHRCETEVNESLLIKLVGVALGVLEDTTCLPSSFPGYKDTLLPICMAYENARRYGRTPVQTTVYEGEHGYVVRIEDSGDGFNYKNRLSQFQLFLDGVDRANHYESITLAKKTYATHLGMGFRTMQRSSLMFAYEGKGNVVNIYVSKVSLQKRLSEVN